MKFEFWHFVIAAILIIVGAWAVISIIKASLAFLFGIGGSVIVLALVVAVAYYGYTRLKPGGQRG